MVVERMSALELKVQGNRINPVNMHFTFDWLLQGCKVAPNHHTKDMVFSFKSVAAID